MKCVTYDDLLLVPQYSEIGSRNSVSLSTSLFNCASKFTLPIISSPMDTITEHEMATTLSELGGFGIIHRYLSIKEQLDQVELAYLDGATTVGAAIGVNGDFYLRADKLLSINKDIILCIDVAHGHHVKVRNALYALKNGVARDAHIMAGNVATLEAFNDVADWGADSIRCGIGGGSICTTRIQTGHGLPGLQTILDCAKSDRDAAVIADGGIRTAGDIVKALAAGADFVMLGSMLSGTEETPGKVYTREGHRFKKYRGMASFDAQKKWRDRSSSPEGVATEVPYKGFVEDILEVIEGAVKSGLSYSGAINLMELRAKARWAEQSGASRVESQAHIY